MSLREQFERCHEKFLGPYAIREAQSGGRQYDQAEHPYRTCFQRDRDRIVHCSGFRRLDFKTQVFVPHEQDHFRTRLTHTLEVAQISRTLARALRVNEDLCEAVALGHDLGHAPFGHAGEKALNELMRDHGGFEHNQQSLRVVDYLEHPYPRFRGVNLTRVVRECLSKHSTPYDTPASDEFDDGLWAPLEGQLVDLGDQIAYTTADLEDALAAGWIDQEQLTALSLWTQAWKVADSQAPQARAIHKRIRAVKEVLGAMADDLVATTMQNIESMRIASPDHARRAPTRCVSFSPSMRDAVGQLCEFLLEKVYQHPACREQAERSGRIVRELFQAYVSDPETLPPRYSRRIDTDGLHRVICDYIAGMTDKFCKQQHRNSR